MLIKENHCCFIARGDFLTFKWWSKFRDQTNFTPRDSEIFKTEIYSSVAKNYFQVVGPTLAF
jgi:hypothetical protein